MLEASKYFDIVVGAHAAIGFGWWFVCGLLYTHFVYIQNKYPLVGSVDVRRLDKEFVKDARKRMTNIGMSFFILIFFVMTTLVFAFVSSYYLFFWGFLLAGR